jgi:16S rRNA (guanine527-N7)-methyltransferase
LILSRDTEHRLRDGLEKLGVAECASVADRLLAYAGRVIEANRTTNLIGSETIDAMIGPHLVDSLSVLPHVRLASPVIDIGSGAGLPGLAIAIAVPRLRMVLLEPRKKRFEFLKATVEALDLRNVEVVQATAETAGRGPWRDRAGSVLIRAVAKGAVALELGVPLLRKSGRLVMYVGKASSPGQDLLAIGEMLGARLTQAVRVSVPSLDAQRHLWIFEKFKTTPQAYPRRSGLPGKEPLKAA